MVSTAGLEQRVAELELRYAELWRLVHDGPARAAWRHVVGLLADDPQIVDLHRETERIRAANRAAPGGPGAGEP